MKKLGLVVAVLMVVAAPAWARVDIKCSNSGKVITVSYVVSEPNKVSGFGLDITVDSGAKIIDVSNYPLVTTNGKYWVYPGSIDIVNGEVNDVGSPVADPNSAGALGGIGTSGITIEMGALYSPTGDNSPNSPPLTGNLLSFTVDKDCCVTITENATRGGVVLTNPASNPDVNSPGVGTTPKFCITEVECLPNTVPYYSQWVAVGKPNCWCYPRQCHGDADGKKEGSAKGGYFYVGPSDLNILVPAYLVREPPIGPGIVSIPNGICADFAHNQEGSAKGGYFRVGPSDLNILVANYLVREPAIGPGVPADCGGSLVPP
jgi:hypothetical protein